MKHYERYEIEVRALPRTGKQWLIIHDSYWDSQTDIFPDADEYSYGSIWRNRGLANMLNDAFGEELSNLKPGTFYCIPLDEGPFGKPEKPFKIPALNRRYKL